MSKERTIRMSLDVPLSKVGAFASILRSMGREDHAQDDDCVVVAGVCVFCGVGFGGDCPCNPGGAFHTADCPDSDATAEAVQVKTCTGCGETWKRDTPGFVGQKLGTVSLDACDAFSRPKSRKYDPQTTVLRFRPCIACADTEEERTCHTQERQSTVGKTRKGLTESKKPGLF